jgi:serine/threonine protein kinase
VIGQTVSHYRILSKLGEGGRGTVYVAEDTMLGRRVAIKPLKLASVRGQTHFRTRFLRESRAASLLKHPHIATVHERAVVLGNSDVIVPHDLPESLLATSPAPQNLPRSVE